MYIYIYRVDIIQVLQSGGSTQAMGLDTAANQRKPINTELVVKFYTYGNAFSGLGL